MQNLGSQPLTSVTIDETTAGALIITQRTVIEDGVIEDGHGDLLLTGVDYDGDTLDFSATAAEAVAATTVAPAAGEKSVFLASVTVADDTYYFTDSTSNIGSATITLTGFSTTEAGADWEALAAGSSKSFRVVITGVSSGDNTDVLDVLRSVPASTDLFITVTGTDGQTTTISDPRSTRVTAR